MGAVIIDGTKRVSVDADWNKIKAEFMTGASYGALAARYGIGKSTIYKKAQKENWPKQRERTKNAVETKTIERTANAAAENAVIAADMKRRLLLRLKRMEENYPYDATEVRHTEGENTVIYRLRDLTAALKDLTDALPKTTGEDKNAPVYELLRRLDGESSV